jgi:hypothetical protein
MADARISALQQLGAQVLRRSQQLREEYARLHGITMRLHSMVNAPQRCPVCSSADVTAVSRSHLRSDVEKKPSVLAYRCSDGHLFTHPAPETETDKAVAHGVNEP